MNKEKILQNTRNWRKTKRGLVTNLFHKMKSRKYVDFDLDFLHQFADCKKFERIYFEWVKSGYKKDYKPTIDRINNKKPYLKKNIQWLNWKENRYKQTMERRSRNGKVIQIKNGEIIKIFRSQREACRSLNINQSNLSAALTGKRKRCAGFEWKYLRKQGVVK